MEINTSFGTPQSLAFSVVIPMHNEADNVVLLLSELSQALSDCQSWEVIAVDDGSTDATFAALSAYQNDLPTLKIYRHRHNVGQSASIMTGVRKAQYPWVITLDGDGQNNPRDIPQLLSTLISHQPNHLIMIVGNRQQRHDHWLRKISSVIANKVRNILLHDHCPDTGCSLKLFHRETFLQLPHFDHLHRFLPALMQRAGGKIINVSVSHRHRLHGKSKYGIHNRLWSGIIDLLGVMWLIRRTCQAEIVQDDFRGDCSR